MGAFLDLVVIDMLAAPTPAQSNVPKPGVGPIFARGKGASASIPLGESLAVFILVVRRVSGQADLAALLGPPKIQAAIIPRAGV